ncbi:unnamed protein product [Ectocarpus fasciculatus]
MAEQKREKEERQKENLPKDRNFELEQRGPASEKPRARSDSATRQNSSSASRRPERRRRPREARWGEEAAAAGTSCLR